MLVDACRSLPDRRLRRHQLIRCKILSAFTFLAFCCMRANSQTKQRAWIGPSSYILNSPTARQSHGFAGLGEKLFVFGGFDGADDVNDLYQFDTTSLTWTTLSGQITGNAPSARNSHGCATTNELLFIFGGTDGNVLLNDLHQFDPAKLQWTEMDSVGEIPSPRQNIGFAAINGKLFVFGGFDGSGVLNDLFQFDLSTRSWSELSLVASGEPPTPRNCHTLTSMNAKLYVFGGWDGQGCEVNLVPGAVYFSDLREFDIATMKWTNLTEPSQSISQTSYPAFRLGHGAVSVNNQLFLFGGFQWPVYFNDMHVFDPTTLAWTDLTDSVQGLLPTARYFQGFAALDNQIFLFGGSDGSGVLKDFFLFDLSTIGWNDLTEDINGIAPTPRYCHGFITMGRILYLFGGSTSSAFLSDLHQFDTTTITWTEMTGLVLGDGPTARALHGFSSLPGKLFVFAGYGEEGLFNDLYVLNLPTMHWTNLTSEAGLSPPPRYAHGFTAANGKLYAFGGQGETGVLGDLYLFDDTFLVWTNLGGSVRGQLPSPRDGHGFTCTNGKIYVFGGFDGSGVVNDVYSFDPESLEWMSLSEVISGAAPPPRSAQGFTATSGKIFVLAGESGSILTDTHERISIYRGTHIVGFTDKQQRTGIDQDLNMLDLSTLEWTDLTRQVAGHSLSSRYYLGLTSVNDDLYAFGGSGGSGKVLNDLMKLNAPADVIWPASADISFFIDVYDWDLVKLNPIAASELFWPVALCGQLFPCSLRLSGNGNGTIMRSGNGSIQCLASSGCTTLMIESVSFVCDQFTSDNSVIGVQGATLQVDNSSFSMCTSTTDGGAIQSYDGATVEIQGTSFEGQASLGSGGAVSVVGGSLRVTGSQFLNCSSVNGGGSISAAEFVCYGFKLQTTTMMMIESSSFIESTSKGPGGAILATGTSVQIEVEGCNFTLCAAGTTGGAISVESSAKMSVLNTVFENNSAFGRGGGALYSQDSSLVVARSVARGNAALSGGGGVVFWSGSVRPLLKLWCDAGWIATIESECTPSSCVSNCVKCAAGTFQTGIGMTACTSCHVGTFSTVEGADFEGACTSCGAGKYSEVEGASGDSTCKSCPAGKYSDAGASVCSLCGLGKYFIPAGGSAPAKCDSCEAGKYSDTQNTFSDCASCEAGKYGDATGSSECLLCPAGKYSTAIGTTSVSTCINCPGGRYSSAEGASSANACSSCPMGTYSLSKYYTYIMNYTGIPTKFTDSEKHCVSFGGHLGSILSEEENELLLRTLPSDTYFDFWIGFYYNTSQNRWTWTDGGESDYVNWGVGNPKKLSQGFRCADFPIYPYPIQNATAWPYLQEEYGLIIDAPLYESPAGSWYNFDCQDSAAWLNGYICSFHGATTCELCAAGKYSNSTGTSSSSSCISCPSGKYSSSLGATSCIVENQTNASSNSYVSRKAKVQAHRLVDAASSYSISTSELPVDKLSKSWIYAEDPGPLAPWSRASKGGSLLSTKYRHSADLKSKESYASPKNIQSTDSFRRASSFTRRRENNRALMGVGNSAQEEIDAICSADNVAAFGACLASSYATLDILDLPTVNAPAYPGMAFPFSVLKKDAYGQIISVDSTSLLEVASSNSTLSISGSSVAKMQLGKGTYSLVLKPAVENNGAGIRHVLLTTPRVFLKGIDAENTDVTMESPVFSIIMANNTQICPIGYILSLDQSASSTTRQASCTRCGPGTYSVDPLAGHTQDAAACLNCPAGSSGCPGGNVVELPLGTWIIMAGMYQLVDCPGGYQLVNSINGIFSHDVQQCVACKPGQYILDSSLSNLTCQSCPVGAMCNGSTFVGLVPGSVWTADISKGYYVLQSCPPGFEIINTNVLAQQCSICAAKTFCVGGSQKSSPCPQGTYSPAGANSSSACLSATFVDISVSLPIASGEFVGAVQQKFIQALATAAQVSADRVVITNVGQQRRQQHIMGPTKRTRSGAGQLTVQSQIAAQDPAAAASISSNLNADSLNKELAVQGLPPATLDSIAVQGSASASSSSIPVGVVVGASIGGFFLLVILLVGGTLLFKKVMVHKAQMDLLAALRNATAGEKATSKHIPARLSKLYEAETILGKGAFGCVVRAKAKHGNRHVAIKIIVPEKGVFDPRDMRRLEREAQVMEMFSACKCEDAVHLIGHDAVKIQPELSWFVMELIDGQNMEEVLNNSSNGPISDLECIKVGRSVLAALKVMHSEGIIHRDIKPANIMRSKYESRGKPWDGKTYSYKLLDFGTALGIDETLARATMMTLANNRGMGEGTVAYMSPEMLTDPENASYPTDIWSLGVTLFQLVTGHLPFEGESDMRLTLAVAGTMNQKAPSVLDSLSEDRRATFDHNLAKVIDRSLEKKIESRFQSVDEMHESLYSCLINRKEASYSVFISYRVASEAPFAHLLFDELNHSVTPAGHRVTVYYDAYRLMNGEDWQQGFAGGLLNSLCFVPVMSYGSTAPMAYLPPDAEIVAQGWEEEPVGRKRLRGTNEDAEDNVLKEYLIATALLERRATLEKTGDPAANEEGDLLQFAFPVLLGRPYPKGHAEYPRMESFFQVQGGGGTYPSTPSPPTNAAVVKFLREEACMPEDLLHSVNDRSVKSIVSSLLAVQGCKTWDHPSDLSPIPLTKQQRELIGTGFSGPILRKDGVQPTDGGAPGKSGGLDEEQLCMMKAQIRNKLHAFHEVIDRAVDASARANGEHAEHEGARMRTAGSARQSSARQSSAREASTGRVSSVNAPLRQDTHETVAAPNGNGSSKDHMAPAGGEGQGSSNPAIQMTSQIF